MASTDLGVTAPSSGRRTLLSIRSVHRYVVASTGLDVTRASPVSGKYPRRPLGAPLCVVTSTGLGVTPNEGPPLPHAATTFRWINGNVDWRGAAPEMHALLAVCTYPRRTLCPSRNCDSPLSIRIPCEYCIAKKAVAGANGSSGWLVVSKIPADEEATFCPTRIDNNLGPARHHPRPPARWDHTQPNTAGYAV